MIDDRDYMLGLAEDVLRAQEVPPSEIVFFTLAKGTLRLISLINFNLLLAAAAIQFPASRLSNLRCMASYYVQPVFGRSFIELKFKGGTLRFG